MKKIIALLVVLCTVFCFSACTFGSSEDTTSKTDSVTLVEEQSIEQVLESDEKWDIENFLPSGADEPQVIGQSGNQIVYEANAQIAFETIDDFYTSLADELSATKSADDDFIIFQWEEDSVEVYIKASKVDNENTIITVDYYNGSVND